MNMDTNTFFTSGRTNEFQDNIQHNNIVVRPIVIIKVHYHTPIPTYNFMYYTIVAVGCIKYLLLI